MTGEPEVDRLQCLLLKRVWLHPGTDPVGALDGWLTPGWEQLDVWMERLGCLIEVAAAVCVVYAAQRGLDAGVAFLITALSISLGQSA